jgi:hypothetical protein
MGRGWEMGLLKWVLEYLLYGVCLYVLPVGCDLVLGLLLPVGGKSLSRTLKGFGSRMIPSSVAAILLDVGVIGGVGFLGS